MDTSPLGTVIVLSPVYPSDRLAAAIIASPSLRYSEEKGPGDEELQDWDFTDLCEN